MNQSIHQNYQELCKISKIGMCKNVTFDIIQLISIMQCSRDIKGLILRTMASIEHVRSRATRHVPLQLLELRLKFDEASSFQWHLTLCPRTHPPAQPPRRTCLFSGTDTSCSTLAKEASCIVNSAVLCTTQIRLPSFPIRRNRIMA